MSARRGVATLLDLMARGWLVEGEKLEWQTPRGVVRGRLVSVLNEKGEWCVSVEMDDGRSFPSLSSAAAAAFGYGTMSGWPNTHVPRLGKNLIRVRVQFEADMRSLYA